MKQYFLQIFKFIMILLSKCFALIKKLFNSWPKAFIGTILLVVTLYYPLGGIVSEKIDRTPDYDFAYLDSSQSEGLEMAAYLINREVNEHIWSANLPFLFPASSLDNMPNFQTGIIKGISDIIKVLSHQIQCLENDKNIAELNESAQLLAYPGNVWLFAPDNKLKTAPSSSSQYRKARKYLKDVNTALKEEKCFWNHSANNLFDINKAVIRGLDKAILSIETEVREGGNSWFDSKADDVFYFNQGRIYAYMMVLRKIGRDFKQVLMAENLYSEWTAMLRSLQNSVEINPNVVVNGELEAKFKANHLTSLGYYVLKAENLLMKVNMHLNGEKQNAN